MLWTLIPLAALALLLGCAVIALRRGELRAQAERLAERADARARGTDRARLQYPQVDLAHCIGCGSCVRACPEEGVLGLLHGQAVVLHGARCVGHGRCAEECPVGAIAVTLGDLKDRKDVPVLGEHGEASGVPGLFLAGEVTGFALIRTAVEHGAAVAGEVARRKRAGAAPGATTLDLCIVGAGPAGLSCALEAQRRGLRYLVLEQDEVGGTVAKYPRRKLVMTQPVTLPLAGTLDRDSYSKEELMGLWRRLAAEHELAIETGHELRAVRRAGEGGFDVETTRGTVRAGAVCLALGRRGTPRRLGVPGEELAKVSYGLLDAESYRERRVLVVGGGDSAVEAALGLAEQPGNEVSLSYRGADFSRIRSRNARRLEEAEAQKRLAVLRRSHVSRIGREDVELTVTGEDGRDGSLRIGNDDVFVLAGGTPPFALLEAAGVSFDHAASPAPPLVAERGRGLAAALAIGLIAAVAALAWAWLRSDYYLAPPSERPASPDHDWLRSSRGLGLGLGVLACTLLAANLAYLLRRSRRLRFRAGSLQSWMTAHVATGILAPIAALVHGGFEARDTAGGHALWAMTALVATGALGRYFYSFVPHAANGRELELDELRGEIAAISAQWDRGNRDFGARTRDEVERLIADTRWSRGFLARAASLIRHQRRIQRTLRDIRARGLADGVPGAEIDRAVRLARRAQRAALMATRFEEVRHVLSAWRFFHRWVALLTVLLLAIHVAAAWRYAGLGR